MPWGVSGSGPRESDRATLRPRSRPVRRGGGTPIASQAGRGVPEISRFYGIVVSMYFKDHAPPHFHACYGSAEVVIEISSLAVTEGRLPMHALALLKKWAKKHQADLLDDWNLARAGKPLKRIPPLE